MLTGGVQYVQNWTDWDSWEASSEIATYFPYYRCGFDYEGCAGKLATISGHKAGPSRSLTSCVLQCFHLEVYVVEFGKWNYRALDYLGKDKREELYKYFEQLSRRAERDAAICDDHGTSFIADWDGFALNLNS